MTLSIAILLNCICFASSEGFEGSWESSQGKYKLRLKVRVDQSDFIGFLHNDIGEKFMLSGIIEGSKAVVSIRDSKHAFICDAEIIFENETLTFATKGSPKTKDTHIPKESSFTKEY